MVLRITRVLVFTLALAATAHLSAGQGDRRVDPPTNVRGLWVLRTSMTSPEAIAGVVRAAVDGGYNTLMMQVRSRGDAYYLSAVDPRAAELRGQPAAFDPLTTALTVGHAAGLKIHAWININLVSSATVLPQSPRHVVSKRPGWLMVPRALAPELARLDPAAPAYIERLARWTREQSESVEGLYLSPITEGAQDYTVSVVAGLARAYAIDGVHLDYTRYPTSEFDHSASAVQAFRASRLPAMTPDAQARLDQQANGDPLAWTREHPEAWNAFRRDRLTVLVERIRAAVKAARPGAILSSAVVPDPMDARDEHLQDWRTWADEGLLDVICPMAYASGSEAFADQVKAAMAGAQGRPVWMGIGAWRIDVAQAAAHLAAARRAGADGVLLFSYDGLIAARSPKGSYLTQLRPAILSRPRRQER